MQRKENSKQPPVQGVQIAERISCIRHYALDTTMTQGERVIAMQRSRDDAIKMLEMYYQHWMTRTATLP